jgi:Fur family zinc uptake transcriptional regulator
MLEEDAEALDSTGVGKPAQGPVAETDLEKLCRQRGGRMTK